MVSAIMIPPSFWLFVSNTCRAMMSAQDAKTITANGRSRNAFGFHVDLGDFGCGCFRHDSFEMSDFGVLVSGFRESDSEAIFVVGTDMTTTRA